MNVELKAVKINDTLSDETIHFSATLYINNKKVGTTFNTGQGMPTEYAIQDTKTRLSFEVFAEGQLDPYNDRQAYGDSGEYIDALLEEYMENKR